MTELQSAILNQLGYNALNPEVAEKLSDILHLYGANSKELISEFEAIEFFKKHKNLVLEVATNELTHNLVLCALEQVALELENECLKLLDKGA